MTEEQLYKLMLEAEGMEDEAGSKYHELLDLLAPASSGGKFIRSGDSSVKEEFEKAEADYIEKRKAVGEALQAWICKRNSKVQ